MGWFFHILSRACSVVGPRLSGQADHPQCRIYTGGAAGNSAQVFAEGARKYLPKPQSILVNFKPGAGTAVAADYVLKQPADGYNLFGFGTDTNSFDYDAGFPLSIAICNAGLKPSFISCVFI